MAQQTDVEPNATQTEAQSPRATNEGGVVLGADARPVATPKSKLPIILGILALIVVSILIWRHYAGWVSTDDAEIEGHIYPISARITGHVVRVTVDNTQWVTKGTVLVQLDPRDYQVAVERAKAKLANAEAAAEAARVGVPINSVNTLSQIHSAGADVESAQAGIGAAEKQFEAAE